MMSGVSRSCAPSGSGGGAGDGLPHSPFDDLYAFATGCVMIGLGLILLHAAGLVTGGIAPFSLVNRDALHVTGEHPTFAALVGGTLIGMGILSIARHGAGVGGTGVLTLWLHRARGINPGTSQIAMDAVILWSRCWPSRPRDSVVGLSAAAMSGVLIAWHRPGRYNGR